MYMGVIRFMCTGVLVVAYSVGYLFKGVWRDAPYQDQKRDE